MKLCTMLAMVLAMGLVSGFPFRKNVMKRQVNKSHATSVQKESPCKYFKRQSDLKDTLRHHRDILERIACHEEQIRRVNESLLAAGFTPGTIKVGGNQFDPIVASMLLISSDGTYNFTGVLEKTVKPKLKRTTSMPNMLVLNGTRNPRDLEGADSNIGTPSILDLKFSSNARYTKIIPAHARKRPHYMEHAPTKFRRHM